jgi:hypothetical protein
MRNSTTRTTKYILEPVVGTCFDSLAEAYEFYNLYSWEVGFGIRYGHSYTNDEHYKSSQDLICQLEVKTSCHLHQSFCDATRMSFCYQLVVTKKHECSFCSSHRGLTRETGMIQHAVDARR